ncbi:UDP-N-acetylmuramoyl-L-alanine--D-glutamate ligase, partial [Ralstonia solanacearum]
MTEPIASPEDTLPVPQAAGDEITADAIAATVDSAEPTPAAETAQAPRMFGDLESPCVL